MGPTSLTIRKLGTDFGWGAGKKSGRRGWKRFRTNTIRKQTMAGTPKRKRTGRTTGKQKLTRFLRKTAGRNKASNRASQDANAWRAIPMTSKPPVIFVMVAFVA